MSSLLPEIGYPFTGGLSSESFPVIVRGRVYLPGSAFVFASADGLRDVVLPGPSRLHRGGPVPFIGGARSDVHSIHGELSAS